VLGSMATLDFGSSLFGAQLDATLLVLCDMRVHCFRIFGACALMPALQDMIEPRFKTIETNLVSLFCGEGGRRAMYLPGNRCESTQLLPQRRQQFT